MLIRRLLIMVAAIEQKQIDKKLIDRNDLYSKIIRNQITELLKVINSKYTVKFPKTLIKQELDNIMVSISLSDSTPSINESASRNNVPKSNDRKVKSKPPVVEPAARCQARIWDDIFDRTTCKQATSIDDEFQVSDYNDINIKKFHKKYILGKQCARKKTLDTNYCILHNRHRPHGNYLEQPSKELCLHFMIDGGYLDNSNLDDSDNDE